MSMVWLSVSLPQTEKFCAQPKISALATAVPCLKVFPPDVVWTSVAGDSTWTSRNSPPEKNATAGPNGTVGLLPSQVGVPGAGAGHGMLRDHLQGGTQRAAPVG